MRRTLIAFVVVASLFAAPALASAEDLEGEVLYELVYEGEFIDQDSAAISAVLPLEFKLYQKEGGKKPIWVENHVVSVIGGNYSLVLGRITPLPKRATEETVYLGVELDGREVIRQPLKAKLISDEVRVGGGGTVTQAAYADRAGDAAMLGGIGADQYARKADVKSLEKKVNSAPSNSGGGGGGGGGTLGGKSWSSQYAGGSGGTAFSLSCPDGYVMVGMEGRAAALVDAVRIVCKKLE